MPASELPWLHPYSLLWSILFNGQPHANMILSLLSLIVSGCVFVILMSWPDLFTFFKGYLTFTIKIRHDDNLFILMLSWVVEHWISGNNTYVVVGTRVASRYPWWKENREDETEEVNGVKVDCLYTTLAIMTWIWTWASLICFSREEIRSSVGIPDVKIHFTCIRWTLFHLLNLVWQAQCWYAEHEKAKTIVFQVKCKGERFYWERCLPLTWRPLPSVVLGNGLRDSILKDATEFLLPSTRSWYGTCGIPYHWGSLFMGLPE